MTWSLRIPVSELQFRFSPSGGPGGQHANKVATRVELRFDVAGSPSLGPRQRARLLERLGPELRVVADDERSQLRNRQLATERFRERLAAALRVDKPRRPTRPTRASKERQTGCQAPADRSASGRGSPAPTTEGRSAPVGQPALARHPVWGLPTPCRGGGRSRSVRRSGWTRSSRTELAWSSWPWGRRLASCSASWNGWSGRLWWPMTRAGISMAARSSTVGAMGPARIPWRTAAVS